MSITSMAFVLFLVVLMAVYFLAPKKLQWVVLLTASLGFYAAAGLRMLPYILVTALSSYAAALAIGAVDRNQKSWLAAHKELSREEKGAVRRRNTAKKRWLMAAGLILNFGLLCVFKYFHFALAQWNRLLAVLGSGGIVDVFTFAAPLGISFYTFQTMGYLVDVYWGNVQPQRNFCKLLLFTSFFPQITQGPISSYSQLAGQLYEGHAFLYENYAPGAQRMIWGYFKKLVLADVLAPWVGAVFQNYPDYSGPAVLMGIFLYSIRIYADFSGYMDIMCGYCQILGIRLEENFLRPYFSKSIAEYWRRWHITLGAWFKNYLYYPIAVSKWNTRIGKWGRKRFGKTFGQALPASIALVAVWLTTGLWHGASWAYIGWGAVNGLFIIASLWLEPVYQRTRQVLHIPEGAWWFRAFQVVRTYILVCLIKVLPEVGTLSQGLGLWRQMLRGWDIPLSFDVVFPYGPGKAELAAAAFAVLLMMCVSLLQRRKPVRTRFGRLPLLIRALALAVLLLMMVYFGVPASGNVEGFLYAQF